MRKTLDRATQPMRNPCIRVTVQRYSAAGSIITGCALLLGYKLTRASQARLTNRELHLPWNVG